MQNKLSYFSPTLKLSFILIYLAIFQIANAQENKNFFAFDKIGVGPLASTNGLGLSACGKFKSTQNTYFNLIIRGLQNEKEAKIQNPNYTNPRPYVYGKLNSVLLTSLSIAKYKTLGQSTSYSPSLKLGVAVGPSLAIIKPYYVYVQGFDNSPYTPKMSLQNPEDEQFQNNILGAAGWNSGLDELNKKLGVHLDINLITEWDKNYRLSRLQTGLRFDYFTSNLNILYNQKNQLFTSLYATYQIGGTGK
jgi:hypothetical protein